MPFFWPQPPNVTISSPIVGWMAQTDSKSRKVAFILIAIEKPWSISSEYGPIRCRPRTRSSSSSFSTSLSVVFTYSEADYTVHSKCGSNLVLVTIVESEQH